MADQNKLPNWQLYLIMLLMLIFGTCNTIIMKLQDQVKVGVDDKGKDILFTHPYFQCANMFIGEFGCLLAYFIRKALTKKSENDQKMLLSPGTQMANQTNLKTTINPLYLAIPATCDIVASTLMFIALTQCAASVYQMMRGIIVIITALLSMAFLGKKQYLHHWASLLSIIAGVTVVGLVGVLMSNKDGGDDESTPTSVLGILLLLLSQCFTGVQFISEEKILSGYYLDPLLIVGLEGFWGCLYYVILLPIFQHINCDGALCHNGKLEDSSKAFEEFGEHPQLIAMSIGIIFSIGAFNACGVAVTKYASAAQRSTVDTCRTLMIWCISLIIGWEKFYWQELVGFFLLVGGTLVYNEIVILPCEVLNKNTKVNIIKRQGALETFRQDGQNPDYLSASPQAVYDANRNKRNLENKLNERYDLVNAHESEQMYINSSDKNGGR